MNGFEIRSMNQDDVSVAIEWAAEEGWNPGFNDAECFYIADPQGFFMGLLDGQPIAVISAVRYGDAFGFIGLYIVRPGFRGQGYGLRVWQVAMDYLKGRNIGLDGVVDQQENYKKSGFRYAYRNVRLEGSGFGTGRIPTGIVRLSDVAYDEVERYDAAFFPDTRSAFIRCWVAQPDGAGFATRRGGRLTGYGLLRPCQSGYKIGPLFADTPDVARQILSALLSHAEEGAKVYFDVPEVNRPAMDLANEYHMRTVFETARMYTEETPELPLQKIYGVTTFELG